MKLFNEMKLVIDSKSINEGYSRVAVAAFVACLDPNVEELTDIKTAVSEAVTNAIIHGYRDTVGSVWVSMKYYEDGTVVLRVKDKGCGIEDVKTAMEPLFTTGGGEQAGIGFSVMESFCDKVKVNSKPGKGTVVTLTKKLGRKL